MEKGNTEDKSLMQLIEERKFDEILSKYYFCLNFYASRGIHLQWDYSA